MVVTLAIVVFYDTSFVLEQAESLVPLVLAGPAIDIFYPRLLTEEPAEGRRLPGLLDARARLSRGGADAVGRLGTDHLTGSLLDTINYLQRALEGYWGWIFVYAYFAFCSAPPTIARAPRTGTDPPTGRPGTRSGSADERRLSEARRPGYPCGRLSG